MRINYFNRLIPSREFLDPSDILSGVKRKSTYEERLASIQAGREGREKYASKKSKKERSSTTNKEKAKNKTFKMIQWKYSFPLCQASNYQTFG